MLRYAEQLIIRRKPLLLLLLQHLMTTTAATSETGMLESRVTKLLILVEKTGRLLVTVPAGRLVTRLLVLMRWGICVQVHLAYGVLSLIVQAV